MNFQFAAPWILVLLLVIPLFLLRALSSGKPGRAGVVQARNRPATLTHAATNLAQGLSRSWKVTWRPLTLVMRLAAIALMIVALARPQMVQGKETITGEGIDIALAVDISGSMASLDFQPNNRLEASKLVIDDFIGERPYDRLGLVVFASEAFSQAPLTLDKNALRRSLDQVELATDLGIDDGTAIGLGIANAAGMLTNSEAKSQIIILLTDGVNNSGQIDPLTAAEAAKAMGIKVYTVGAGRLGQVPVPVQGMFGKEIVYQESQLDEETLRQVARITGGKYYRAEDTSGLRAIYDEINKLEKSQVEVEVYNLYQELAGWLLVPALFLMLSEVVLRNTIFRRVP
ncbi:MAG: VWA domain-containing protein [Chloroflexota bacterium]|nr:VWA domain-containing protein [Chloroflexota bacterium]